MINKYLINPKSLAEINAYLSNPKLPLLIYTEKGNNLKEILNYILTNIIKIDLKLIDSYPYILKIDKSSTRSIGISEIKKINNFLKLKVPLKNKINRVILVKNGQFLTNEAQNNLLKNLEEHPKDTIFIIVAYNLKTILPTIKSRMQLINLLKPTRSQLLTYFEQANYPKTKINEALNISDCNLSITKKILENDPKYAKALEYAKLIINSKVYNKMVLVNDLSSDKESFKLILFMIIQMSKYGIISKNKNNALFWQKVLERSINMRLDIESNVQLKILVLDYLLNFGR